MAVSSKPGQKCTVLVELGVIPFLGRPERRGRGMFRLKREL